MVQINSSPELKKALAILARDPRNIGAHIQAGVCYSQEKKWDESVFHLTRALTEDKKNPLILEKLCDVLISAHQPSKARKYARRLLDLKKRDAGTLHMMARIYDAMGEVNKTLQWINLALEQAPDDVRILSHKARHYSEAGEIDKTLTIHKGILKLNPMASESLWLVAQLQKLEGKTAEDTILQIKSAIAATSSESELSALHYAAGKIEQDIGKYADAYVDFEKANTLHDIPITADRIVASHINLRETYSKEFFEAMKPKGNQSHRPIFILGQTRSGTTLTESLCASHSKISAGGELLYFQDINKKMEIASVFEKTHHGHIHGLTGKNLKTMAAEIISKTSHLTTSGTRLTDKMPHNFLHIGVISLLFPNAQIIHCRRHPLDNCLSIFSNPMMEFHKEYKSRLEVLGEHYRNYVQIMEFWKEVCPIPIHDVYYEDLVTNTEAASRRIIDHLGLEWEDGVMDRSGSQKSVKTLSVWQVRQPVFQTSKGKWRNYEKQLAPLIKILGPYVEDYENELKALDSGSDQVEV